MEIFFENNNFTLFFYVMDGFSHITDLPELTHAESANQNIHILFWGQSTARKVGQLYVRKCSRMLKRKLGLV